MSVDNGMIALNIYNKPPAQEANETTTKINQTEQNLNLNTERPQQKIVYYDNIRSEIPQNYSSAPRNNNKRNIESTIDESSDSTKNNQKKINKISPVVPVVPVVTKPVQYPLFQQINYQQIPRQPLVLANPQMIPYNAQYGQPIIVQGNYANNNNKINNNNTIKIKNKNCLENIKFPHAITGSNNNINNLSANHKIIPKRAIQVIKKPQAKKEKSRNYMSIKDVNTINIDARIHINEYNPNYYFTTNDKNINLLSNKLQTAQNSKKKSQKIIRTEKKNNVIKKLNKNVQNSNIKLFNHINNTKKTINCLENTEGRISKTSLSPSLKNLILKTKGIANLRKNKINNNTINKHTYKNSYISSDSQKLVKNLKIGNS